MLGQARALSHRRPRLLEHGVEADERRRLIATFESSNLEVPAMDFCDSGGAPMIYVGRVYDGFGWLTWPGWDGRRQPLCFLPFFVDPGTTRARSREIVIPVREPPVRLFPELRTAAATSRAGAQPSCAAVAGGGEWLPVCHKLIRDLDLAWVESCLTTRGIRLCFW